MGETLPKTSFMIMNEKVYDYLKAFAQVYLPALGTLYFAVAGIWSLPSAQEVVGTIVAVDACLGTVLTLSGHVYDKSGAGLAGTMDIVQDPEGKKTFSLNLNGDPQNLVNADTITFKVNAPSVPIEPQVPTTMIIAPKDISSSTDSPPPPHMGIDPHP